MHGEQDDVCYGITALDQNHAHCMRFTIKFTIFYSHDGIRIFVLSF
jgi:hypothetical protein